MYNQMTLSVWLAEVFIIILDRELTQLKNVLTAAMMPNCALSGSYSQALSSS